ncbi:MAG: glycosyltransferase family 9 protein [bacterium]|nr:glycosyltransferase family 9 protein [bacterium]
MKKILVIRLSSFGDIVLSFPLLKKIKEKLPECEVHFLTKKNYEDVLLLNPDIDKIIFNDDRLSDTRKKVTDESYDLIIDIHKNFRSIYLSAFNSKNVVRYKKENFKKFLFVKFKINFLKEVTPVWKKYILPVKRFLNFDKLNFEVSELTFDRTKSIEGKYTVIAPASRHFTKTYPAEKFIQYINNNTGTRFVLVGDNSKKEKLICSEIERSCKNVLNLCGKLTINNLAEVIYNSSHLICNDSAVLHLAEALGKKVIAIFGSTVREFGFFPQLEGSEVYENEGLVCRPCTHIGRGSCPKGHFKCMMGIEIQLRIRK